ncbi:hypothetical protein KEH51_02260 [[Brevibacterium] frigoritolerans]|uniref:Uncharacterized protein n=1 Tax=Peribacillus frigoritolerans TaxID=450367 RepID=A0A941FGS5_9BACI|nr:hypothetical protein [Peribacillus frigoritolerans]
MERKVRDSCGKSVAKGDPAGERRGGSRTARGKRVPGVEIITHTHFRKSAPVPSLLGISACGVWASRLFGSSVANFFHPLRITVKKNMKDKLVMFKIMVGVGPDHPFSRQTEKHPKGVF